MNFEDQNKYIGKKIKEYRKARKFTQSQLGEKIGVKDNTISAYERGVIELPSSKLHEIARVLGVSYTSFLPLETTSKDETMRKAMLMAGNNLDEDQMDFLNNLVEKSLSLDEDERKDFFENLRFAIKYFEEKK